MRRPIWHLGWSAAAGVIAAVALGNACLLQTDPRYCDRNEDCEAGEVCDLMGLPAAGGHANTCIAANLACPTACANPAPVCADMECRACASSDECTAAGLEPVCRDDGACVECVLSSDCTGDRPRCQDGACVTGCQGPADCAGDPAGPLCLDDGSCGCTQDSECAGGTVCEAGSCQPCAEHEQCDSGICDLATGACAAPEQVAHVATTGTEDPGCGASPAEACKTIALALGRGTPWILLSSGDYVESLAVSGRALGIVGQDGASIASARAGYPVLDVDGQGTRLSLDRVTIRGASGGTYGVRCLSGAELRVYRSRVSDGIGGAGGIRAELGCDLTVERTQVRGNAGVGISVNDASFTVQNCVIAQNASFGLERAASPTPELRAILRFNTIAENGKGLSCESAIEASHNILWRNQDNIQPTAREEISFCMDSAGMAEDHSIVFARDVDFDPGVSADGDYRLASGSPAVDAAESWPAEVREDIDGDPRPTGARVDIGADELAAQ